MPNYYLCVQTDGKYINIPVEGKKTISRIDSFTMLFKNEMELKQYLLNKGLIKKEHMDMPIKIKYRMDRKDKTINVFYEPDKNIVEQIKSFAESIKEYYIEKLKIRNDFEDRKYLLLCEGYDRQSARDPHAEKPRKPDPARYDYKNDIMGDYKDIVERFPIFDKFAKLPGLLNDMAISNLIYNHSKFDKFNTFKQLQTGLANYDTLEGKKNFYIALYDILLFQFYNPTNALKEVKLSEIGFKNFCDLYLSFKEEYNKKHEASGQMSFIDKDGKVINEALGIYDNNVNLNSSYIPNFSQRTLKTPVIDGLTRNIEEGSREIKQVLGMFGTKEEFDTLYPPNSSERIELLSKIDIEEQTFKR